ncbi:MAG: WD40-repeat-containing domain protein [Benniella sp.]|nr:MAG: WD40-repeat-containing domain protein [Benniella sp.]
MASSSGSLSVHQTLDLTALCLENAQGSKDAELALELCIDAEVALSGIKSSQRRALIASKKGEDQTLSKRIATSYVDLGTLQDSLGRSDKTHTNFKKAVQWGGNIGESKSSNDVKSGNPGGKEEAQEGEGTDARGNTAPISQHIFTENVNPPAVVFTPPQQDERFKDIRQLSACLSLLQHSPSPDNVLEPTAREWIQSVENDEDEQERLRMLATEVIRGFVGDELKDSKAVAEVMCLAPVLDQQNFRFLLSHFYSCVDQSDLLNIHHLQGLADLIHGVDPGYLDSDDLVKILELLSLRLRDTHRQSSTYIYQLTLGISHILDAMADTKVNGLDREKLHTPLGSYLDELRAKSDPYLVYQAAYAYQALLYVPDDETPWQSAVRRTWKVIGGVCGLVSAAKGLDLIGFMDGLRNIQQGVAGVSVVYAMTKSAYKDATSLAQGGKDFLDSLKDSFSFDQKRAWYPALRGMDTLIRDGHLVKFKTLVCEAPCRRDPAFQWGVCQRLGEMAANSMWGPSTRQDAVSFLDELYRNDAEWGHQVDVKQWILTILIQLSSLPGSVAQYATQVLDDLRTDGDAEKQAMYQSSRENGLSSYTLRIDIQSLESSQLLDRAQNKPDVEGDLRRLRKTRLEHQKNTIYIPPQAKANLKASDDDHFPLMEAVLAFLNSDQHQVLLLLGDSGAGKSTFNKALECELWSSYKKGGPIPLHISLPTIDRPDQDMIAKQFRRLDFTDIQIKELKDHRELLLICDGYDECQQTRNLYIANQLNQPDEWKAKMVISCRSEYIGADYRDRFLPGHRNQSSKTAQLQEAVIIPFSTSQVEDYIDQYVAVYQPLWKAQEYKDALDRIPSLKELVGNPFLMTLTLDVLPRMMDPGQHLSTTRVTRVLLYDQFIEQWLERGKRRLSEKELNSSARAAFESLSDEGFTINGMDFLKKLSVAIYKEQDGQPIVEYSRFQDEGSWKSAFFGRSDDQYLLREACPLVRNGNQYRFIHRSMLEYGVARAIFDPQDWKETTLSRPSSNRRGSMSSIFSFEIHDIDEVDVSDIERGPDLNSPLAWRRFVKEPSVIQFLEERVQQEPLFKKQLLDYIDYSKKDKKWRIAAANAITILVRAGVQFNHADLRGIQIPNADLSYGVFHSAQMQGSDLRQVNLHGTWLRRARLDNTQMTRVQFSELPSLKQDGQVSMCVYSPDGETIAVRLSKGSLKVYSTSNWETLWTSEGHRGRVVYSPNSSQIASGSSIDHTVRLWDIRTGTCIQTLNGHDSNILSIAYSPQGDQIASSSDDKTIKIWDVESGECRIIWIGHTRYVSEVIYSPKGTQIASRSYEIVRIWDVEKKSCLHTMKGHEGWVLMIAYSPQGNQLASASEDCTVRLWDVTTGECCHILTGHDSDVYSIVYSPNGNQIASASADQSVRLWDADRGVCLYTLQGHTDGVQCAVYSLQGDIVASSSHDKTVRLWDVATGVCQQTLTGHTDVVWGVVFSPKGDRVASSSDDKTVRLWDVGAGLSSNNSRGHSSSVLDVMCSPRGDQVATRSSDRTVRLWDVETGVCRHVLQGHTNAITSIGYSPPGDQIATGSHDTTVRLWNIETGAYIHILEGGSRIFTVAYSPQGDQLASGGYDNAVRLWDVKSGECRHILTGHTSYINDVVYSKNSDQFASSSVDSTLRIWNAESGTCNYTLSGHSDKVNCVVYSPQNNQIASASGDKTVRVWDVGTGKCRHILHHKAGKVYSVAYSPGGDQITSGDWNGSMNVWDAASGECLWTFADHSRVVDRIVYSSRGDFVVSASHDKSVRLWDVTSGQCRAVIRDFQDGVNGIAWIEAAGVSYLVTGCGDGVVGVWQILLDGDPCDVSLKWMTTKGVLDVEEATIQDVQGLSQINRKLLEQRGAVGGPIQRL